MMREDERVQWQPLSQLEYVLGIVQGMTAETREQRGLFRESGVSSLDTAAISRIRSAYADRLHIIRLFREQADRWGKETLTPDQKRDLEELRTLLDEDERLSREIQRLFGVGSAGKGRHEGDN
jgi:hypothetical protein